ncbi:MAG: hypothetical protein KAJ75_08725, partial [Alphaproteobacteria bacterium]|nr:hypothetical protein [Alphaproteobacteria bacterium]
VIVHPPHHASEAVEAVLGHYVADRAAIVECDPGKIGDTKPIARQVIGMVSPEFCPPNLELGVLSTEFF